MFVVGLPLYPTRYPVGAAGSSSPPHAQDPAIYRQQMIPLWVLPLRLMRKIPDHGVKVAILNIAQVLMFYRKYLLPYRIDVRPHLMCVHI